MRTGSLIMSESSSRARRTSPKPRPALWQLALVGVSVVLMVVGAGIGFVGGSDDAGAAPQTVAAASAEEVSASGETSRQSDGLVSGFLPGGPGFPSLPVPPGTPGTPGDPDAAPSGENGAAAPSGSELLSPALFKLGFGFFIGFSMAYAVRTFMKVSLVAAGFFAMLLFGLQYAGIIEVNWNVMADRYDSVAAWIGAQTQSFGAFVSGALPGTGAALAGGVIGLRRS